MKLDYYNRDDLTLSPLPEKPDPVSPPYASQVKPGVLPSDPAVRKAHPIFSGVLKYFPRALTYVSHVSKVGSDQHNPGQPLHWEVGKSNDHADTLIRHQIEAGTFDTDNVRHSGKVAWRALAQLEIELQEAEKRGEQIWQA